MQDDKYTWLLVIVTVTMLVNQVLSVWGMEKFAIVSSTVVAFIVLVGFLSDAE